jgi:hypothetical protein
MVIKIHGHLFTPQETKHHDIWRVYGTRQTFTRSDGRLAPMPATWELVAERSRGKVGFPTFELEPTDGESYRFYKLICLDDEGKEVWHRDDEPLTLPSTLPDEFEPPFDVPTWLLWNLERVGAIAPGQIENRI